MFIRVKTVKGNRYFYLVENSRVEGKATPVQQVVEYLGSHSQAIAKLESNDYPNKRELLARVREAAPGAREDSKRDRHQLATEPVTTTPTTAPSDTEYAVILRPLNGLPIEYWDSKRREFDRLKRATRYKTQKAAAATAEKIRSNLDDYQGLDDWSQCEITWIPLGELLAPAPAPVAMATLKGKGERTADPWNELNPRQRTYLEAIYQEDQAAERYEAQKWHHGHPKRSADVWRWLPYNVTNIGRPTPLKSRLLRSGVVDEGTGSTLTALESRGLILYEQGDGLVARVRLTTKGRSVARLGLGETAPKKQPKGQLKERQWEALVTAYAAGEEGLKGMHADYGGFSWRWTWLRLRDYYDTGKGLVEERNRSQEYYLTITSAGREYYEQNWQRYRELYPDVEFPNPVS